MESSYTDQLNVAIIGARTNHQGTGPWIARFLQRHGAAITGVLGTSKETALDATRSLSERFGIECNGYVDWSTLIAAERPDLLVIASPPATHRQYLNLALEANIPVFCEKPFIWDNKRNNLADADALLTNFKNNKVPLFINTQCPENLEEFQKIYPSCDMKNIQSFEMELCPASKGKDMLVDAMPHAWSMITALAGKGKLETIKASFSSPQKCDVHGVYSHSHGQCDFRIKLSNLSRQPRPFGYAINGARVDRIINIQDYSMSFQTDSGIYPIEDPVEKKIKKLLTYLKNKNDFSRIQQKTIDFISLEMDLLVKTIEAA